MGRLAVATAALLIGVLEAPLSVSGTVRRNVISSQLAKDPDVEVEVTVSDRPPRAFDPPPALPQGLQAADLDATAAHTLAQPDIDSVLSDIVEFWHKAAVRAHTLDYSKTVPGSDPPQAEKASVVGPAYTSRALAIVHLAIWDAYVGISREEATYLQYNRLPRVDPEDRWVAIFFAVSRAASCAIDALFASQAPQLATALAGSDVAVANGETAAMDAGEIDAAAAGGMTFSAWMKFRSSRIRFLPVFQGVVWGQRVCRAILADRADDGHDAGDVYTEIPVATPPAPYAHAPDPTVLEVYGFVQQDYAAHWGGVRGFGIDGIEAGALPRLPPPPPPSGALDYPNDFAQVQCVGRRDAADCDAGSGVEARTDEELETGVFWAYDGAFKIGLPNRLYNDVMDAIVDTYVASGEELAPLARARLYAVANVVMADAAIAAWREKYIHNFWRPVVGIRNDPELPTEADWRPVGSPQTNMCSLGDASATSNPSFPAYPSGHATIGTGALAAVRDELALDDSFTFKFTSAEFSAGALDAGCETERPEVTRELTIAEAIQQNQDARAFLGVHWQFDSVQGGVLGEEVAALVLDAFPAKSPAP